jgi:SAM-dependent methyltransferase
MLRRRYNLLAWIYDSFDLYHELFVYRRARRELFAHIAEHSTSASENTTDIETRAESGSATESASEAETLPESATETTTVLQTGNDYVNPISILDAGCGSGKNIPHYPQRAHVTALDISPKMLLRAKRRKAARAKRERKQVSAMTKIELVEADLFDLPPNCGPFDHIVLSFVTMLYHQPTTLIEALRQRLKPGGEIHILEWRRSERRLGRAWLSLTDPLFCRLFGVVYHQGSVALLGPEKWNVKEERSFYRDVVWLVRAQRSE